MGKNKKMVQANIGVSLYDMNKQLMLKEPLLNLVETKEAIENLVKAIAESSSKAWMLLNNERQDFTIFYHSSDKILKGNLRNDLRETILNRGKLISIDKQIDGNFEIWVKDNNEAFCYMFFDYSNAIIDY